MKVRVFQPDDLEVILKIFYENVHKVCQDDYTSLQLDAWAPKDPDVLRWKNSLEKNYTVVAEMNNHIVGFGNIGGTGYIDRLYVDYQYLGKGIASAILNELENYATKEGVVYMNTSASITAKDFFERKGYIVLKEETEERRGVRLKRYLMEKKLK